MSVNKVKSLAGIVITDSTIANQATELLLEHETAFKMKWRLCIQV
jgi:hypothetical protein